MRYYYPLCLCFMLTRQIWIIRRACIDCGKGYSRHGHGSDASLVTKFYIWCLHFFRNSPHVQPSYIKIFCYIHGCLNRIFSQLKESFKVLTENYCSSVLYLRFQDFKQCLKNIFKTSLYATINFKYKFFATFCKV